MGRLTSLASWTHKQIWLVVWRFFMTFHWVGNNTTSQLTFSPFVRGVGWNHQSEMDQWLNQHVGMLGCYGMVCFHSQDDLFRLLVQDSENFAEWKTLQESNMTMEHQPFIVQKYYFWAIYRWFPHGNYLSFRGSSLEAGGPLCTVSENIYPNLY